MEHTTRRCVQCGTEVVLESICSRCRFDNQLWFKGELPVWIFALTKQAASECAELNSMTRGTNICCWRFIDSVIRLSGLERAIIWRFDDYYRRNDLLTVEKYITARRFTYVEAPIQPPIVKRRGKEA